MVKPLLRSTPAVVLALVLLSVVGAITLRTLRHRAAVASESGSGKSSVHSFPGSRPALPPELLFTTSGLDGGPGSLLFAASGDGRDAKPIAGSRFVGAFAESPSGSRTATIDYAGRVHLEPDGLVWPGSATSVVFSPEGKTLAACAGTWPPHVFLLSVRNGVLEGRNKGEGCDPQWSGNERWLAFRSPGRARGQFVRGRLAVLDTNTDEVQLIRGDAPFAWSPFVPHRPEFLTLVSGGRIVNVDPASGARMPVVALRRIEAFKSKHLPGPVTMLSWSPDGRLLAVAFGRGRFQDGGVYLVGSGGRPVASIFLGRSPRAVDATIPQSVSWSSQDRLLMEMSDRRKGPYSQVIGPRTLSPSIPMQQPTWSPDGRWVLGRTARGWIAVDPLDPSVRMALGPGADWTQAEWCCPPVPTVYPAGRR